MASSVDRLAGQIAALRARVDRVTRSPQLANSSIENGSLKVKDAAGQTTMIVGQQYDGTGVAASVNGPRPPTPSNPITSVVGGGLSVRWDGTFPVQTGFDAPVVAPMDFSRVDIHVSNTNGFTPSASTKRGEISSPAGGELAVLFTGDAFVRLVAVSLSGKSSEPSGQSTTVDVPGTTATGAVVMFAGSTAPVGYLLCNGASVSRTTYAALFDIIGTTYGGTGSVFNVPNLKGRVPVGLDAAQTEFNALGDAGGAKTHTLTAAEMPSHDHNVSVVAAGNHSHSYTVRGGNAVFTTAGGTGWDFDATGTTSTAGNHGHTVNETGVGGSGAHNNLQPYIVMNFIIKT